MVAQPDGARPGMGEPFLPANLVLDEQSSAASTAHDDLLDYSCDQLDPFRIGEKASGTASNAKRGIVQYLCKQRIKDLIHTCLHFWYRSHSPIMHLLDTPI